MVIIKKYLSKLLLKARECSRFAKIMQKNMQNKIKICYLQKQNVSSDMKFVTC